MRVFWFGDGKLEQVGKFIDEGGNNFWGTEVVTTAQGERLFAGSDRDFGLYILRYTGPRPGAAAPLGASPAPSAATPGRDKSDPRISWKLCSRSKSSSCPTPGSSASSRHLPPTFAGTT